MKTTKIKTILKNIASDSDVLKELIATIIPKLDLPPYMLGFNFTKKRKIKGDKKMDLNDVIKAKIEMENSIRDAVREAMERFEKETGITPGTINIHLAAEIEERISPRAPIELYARVRYAIIGVEAIVTL